MQSELGSLSEIEDHAIRVLIVEDSVIFRVGLASIVDDETGLVVAGEIAELSDVPSAVVSTRPDVVLLGMDQFEHAAEKLVTQIRERSPDTGIILLGSCDDARCLQRLIDLGVRACLPKDVPRRYLVSVIHMSQFNDLKVVLSQRVSAENGDSGVLSPREREVILLVAKAMTNAQIGRRLKITEGTVKRHLRNVFVKLQASSRIDAVNKAVAASLIR